MNITRLILRATAATLMTYAAFATQPEAANASTRFTCSSTGYCVTTCPDHPDELCASYNCPANHASCGSDATCVGSMPYHVKCPSQVE